MKPANESDFNGESKSIDLTIKLLLIVILLVWCAMIILPFVVPVLWGIILAITIHPLYKKLLKLFKGKKGLASTVITLMLLLLLIVPAVWMISSAVDSAGKFITALRENTLIIPPPDKKVAEWPVIGEPIYTLWQSVTTNLEATLKQYSDQIITIGDKFLGAIKSVASNFLMMILSIIISGILLSGSEKSEKSAVSFASRLSGSSGEEFTSLIVLTIRNVAKGILGVAFIQFILLGALFIVADVPFAGLWAIFVLMFAILQLPVGIVGIPVIIYFYTAREPLPATLWSVLTAVLALSDNFIKPWLMGKGAPVPMLVIFLGAIGGMIMSGFIGLFTGAIILSIGYKMAMIWMKKGANEQQSESQA
jgi:predicted PurR-regulated permease PerM